MMAADFKGTRSPEDARWLAMIGRGGRHESKALEEIQNRYGKMVINFVEKNSGRREDGQDMLQEAMLALASNLRLGKFRGEGDLGGYLMRIAKNKWLNELRKQKGKAADLDVSLLGDQDEPEALEEVPELEMLRNPELRALLKTMSELHKGCLAILKMFHWYDWPFKKIAELLRFPSADSAKMKKKRCADELKAYLNAHPKLKAYLRREKL